jgi:hypothetical protein
MSGKPQTAMQRRSDAALYKAYEDAAQKSVKDLAQGFTCDAVKTLVTIMKNTKAPPGVRRQCAMDILNQGWDRPAARVEGEIASKGLTINILHLSTGVTETIHSDNPEGELIGEALDVAQLIADQKELTP